jgi:hypothetical protein
MPRPFLSRNIEDGNGATAAAAAALPARTLLQLISTAQAFLVARGAWVSARRRNHRHRSGLYWRLVRPIRFSRAATTIARHPNASGRAAEAAVGGKGRRWWRGLCRSSRCWSATPRREYRQHTYDMGRYGQIRADISTAAPTMVMMMTMMMMMVMMMTVVVVMVMSLAGSRLSGSLSCCLSRWCSPLPRVCARAIVLMCALMTNVHARCAVRGAQAAAGGVLSPRHNHPNQELWIDWDLPTVLERPMMPMLMASAEELWIDCDLPTVLEMKPMLPMLMASCRARWPRYVCEACGAHSSTLTEQRITRLPQVLLLHVNRADRHGRRLEQPLELPDHLVSNA